VRDLGNQNGPSLAVTFELPQTRRAVQALQHAWVSSDITNYHVILTAQSTGAQIATLDISPAAYNTSTTSQRALAAFTGLPGSDSYTVSVQAWGSNPTTPETALNQPLNTQSPATAVFDFTENADHNIETVVSKAVTITLDSYEFSGTANLQTQVVDAALKPPASGPSFTAVMPTPGLYYVDSDSDVVGDASYGPDGHKDGHYRYIHNFAQPTTISNFDMFDWDFSGRWDSLTFYTRESYGCAFIGVFVNGVAQTQSLPTNAGSGQYPSGQQAIGTFNGLTTIDLYMSNGQVTAGSLGVWAYQSDRPNEELNFEGLVH
jgi:hypothetical protein